MWSAYAEQFAFLSESVINFSAYIVYVGILRKYFSGLSVVVVVKRNQRDFLFSALENCMYGRPSSGTSTLYHLPVRVLKGNK